MVKEGKFREDLYYRINVFPITIPPLRQRKEDIALLASHFTHVYNRESKKKIEGLNRAALDILMAYDWPGNVRQLENVIERAVILCDDKLIAPKHLPANLVKAQVEISAPQGNTLPEIVESIEKQKIIEALNLHKTQRKAAEVLGLTERMLGYKMRKYNV